MLSIPLLFGEGYDKERSIYMVNYTLLPLLKESFEELLDMFSRYLYEVIN